LRSLRRALNHAAGSKRPWGGVRAGALAPCMQPWELSVPTHDGFRDRLLENGIGIGNLGCRPPLPEPTPPGGAGGRKARSRGAGCVAALLYATHCATPRVAVWRRGAGAFFGAKQPWELGAQPRGGFRSGLFVHRCSGAGGGNGAQRARWLRPLQVWITKMVVELRRYSQEAFFKVSADDGNVYILRCCSSARKQIQWRFRWEETMEITRREMAKRQ